MAVAVGLGADFLATDLRRLAQSLHDGGQVRRLLALAVIYDGGSRSEAARIGGVGLQTVRDWVLRFNRDGPDGLVDGKAPWGRPRLDTSQRAALAAAVESGPIPAAHGVVRWRLVDLVQWIRDEFAVSISTQILSRELRSMGYRKLTAVDLRWPDGSASPAAHPFISLALYCQPANRPIWRIMSIGLRQWTHG